MISVSFFLFPFGIFQLFLSQFYQRHSRLQRILQELWSEFLHLHQHQCFFKLYANNSERILNFWLPVRRRINERTLLADISGWERRQRLSRRLTTGASTAIAPATPRHAGDGSLSSWAALQDTIWHCTLRRSDYLESMRSWAATYYRLRSLTILSALHSLFLLLSCLRSRSGYWGSLLQAWGCRRR